MVRVVRIVGPFVLSAFVAWGAVQYTKGQDSQRLENVESANAKIEQKLDLMLTREEFGSWKDEQRDNFRELRHDVRQLRKPNQ